MRRLAILTLGTLALAGCQSTPRELTVPALLPLETAPPGLYYDQNVTAWHGVHRRPYTVYAPASVGSAVTGTPTYAPGPAAPRLRSAPAVRADDDCPPEISQAVCVDWKRHRGKR